MLLTYGSYKHYIHLFKFLVFPLSCEEKNKAKILSEDECMKRAQKNTISIKYQYQCICFQVPFLRMLNDGAKLFRNHAYCYNFEQFMCLHKSYIYSPS